MRRGPPKLRARRRHAADPAPACLQYGALTGVQLKTAIHAMYGYVDGVKIDVADCRECVRAAAPRRAAQCTAIGLNRCCGVQLRLTEAGRSPMRGADGCVGDPARPRHRPGADVEGGELAQLMH